MTDHSQEGVEEEGAHPSLFQHILQPHQPRNVNEVHEERLTKTERLADFIADFSGSLPFLYLNGGAFVFWILLNTLLLRGFHFDPYPFQFLTMAVSLEAIFLSIFVLISQNRQSAKDRLVIEQTYQMDLHEEEELKVLRQYVEDISQMQAQMGQGLARLLQNMEELHGQLLAPKPQDLVAPPTLLAKRGASKKKQTDLSPTSAFSSLD